MGDIKREKKPFSISKIIFVHLLSLLLVLSLVVAAEATPNLSKVKLSVKPLDLSRPPSTEEIMAAGQLGGALYPTHDIGDKEKEKKVNLSFGEAIQEWNKHEYKKAIKMFRKHIEEYPDSPWASEAVLHIGCDATYNGRYTEAEQSFAWILEKNKDKDYEGAKILLNKAKARLAILKVYQNNFKEATKLFNELKKESSDWRDRTYAAHWIQRLSRYKSNELAMLNCGTQALAYLLEKDGRKEEARKIIELLPETAKGQSTRDLSEIASQYGYILTALKASISELKDLPLPAIVHIDRRNQGDSGHYWILEKSVSDMVGLFDPQSGNRFEQSLDELSKEWSGIALVFSHDENLPGIKLAENEMEQIYGGCCGAPRPEDGQGDPDNKKGPKSDSDDPDKKCGSPTWSVNMVNMNLFVTDVPLWYGNPIGPSLGIQLSYNSQSSIANNEPFGNKWQFNYGSYLVVDTGGNVIIFMPDGRRDIYPPDGSGGYIHPYQVFNKLTKISENYFELRFPDDTLYIYRIPPGTSSLQPFLVEIRDVYGQSLTFGYNADVQLDTVTDALGRTTTMIYNAEGLVIQVTDPFGRSATFEYDGNRNLNKITDMGGYWTSFTYDNDVYITGIENTRGKRTFYVEPADGIPANSDNYPPPGDYMWQNYRITVTNPLGGKEEYFYYGGCDEFGCNDHSWYVSPRNYVQWQSWAINNFRSNPYKTHYLFTRTANWQQGEIRKILYPEGGYVEYGYDASTGNRTSVRDAHGHTTYYTYNDMGRVTSVTDAKGTTTTMTYDTNGVDLLQVQNGLGTITKTYNSTHDVTSITDRLGNKTAFTHNSFGQIESQTDAKDVLNITTNYLYDAQHQLKQKTKDGQILDNFTYDPVGRIKTRTDSTGLTLSYDYNNLNHISKITYPDSKFITYTYSGCCPRLVDSVTERSGRTTRYSYDFLEHLAETVNPEGGVIHYEYDANGNLVKLVDSNGNVTSFEYDRDDRLIRKTYADGKYISFIYDGAGLLTKRTNARGINTDFGYDSNHNLLFINYSDDTPDVTYEYDDYNRVKQRQDAIGIYQYGYDANSQLITIDGPWANDTITYNYDELGRRTGLTPQGGQAIIYTYDNLNRVTGIQIGTNTYSYSYSNASPLLQNLTRPNGSLTNYAYDTLNRLTEISNKNSSNEIINKYVYAYNQVDMRSSETITNGNPITSFQNELTIYDYNKVNQLLSSTNLSKAFTYDDDGNMTQSYTPEGYEFTASYDVENRLRSIEYTDGSGVIHKTEYLYSGDDFLVEMKKYENSSLVSDIRFVRDGSLLVQVRDASNNIAHEYVWGPNLGGGIGGLLNLNVSGQNYSYLYDGKGNVAILLDSSQAIVTTYTYDTFGNLLSKTGTLDQPFKFSTKPYDEKAGLYYYGYRFYSPISGRWLTRDPLGEAGGINLYGFVEENPINFWDTFGLQSNNDYCENERNECNRCLTKCTQEVSQEPRRNMTGLRIGIGILGCLTTGGTLALVCSETVIGAPICAVVGCLIGAVVPQALPSLPLELGPMAGDAGINITARRVCTIECASCCQ